MTRSAKRDIDRDELTGIWQKQAAELGFDAKGLVAEAEREVAGSKTAAQAMQGQQARGNRVRRGERCLSPPVPPAWMLRGRSSPVRTGDRLTTERAVADEKETIALMQTGQGRGAVPMRGRGVDKALRNGPLTNGQKDAVRLILSSDDRVVGVQGYAGSGKTTMLNRARTLMEKKGYAVRGLAPSASAARTLEGEAGIGSETLQRFLMRYKASPKGA